MCVSFFTLNLPFVYVMVVSSLQIFAADAMMVEEKSICFLGAGKLKLYKDLLFMCFNFEMWNKY